MEIRLSNTARLRSDARQWHLEARKEKRDGGFTAWGKRGSYPRITDIAAQAIVDLLMRDGDGVTDFASFTEAIRALAFPLGEAMRPDLVVQKFVELCNATTMGEEPAVPVDLAVEDAAPESGQDPSIDAFDDCL